METPVFSFSKEWVRAENGEPEEIMHFFVGDNEITYEAFMDAAPADIRDEAMDAEYWLGDDTEGYAETWVRENEARKAIARVTGMVETAYNEMVNIFANADADLANAIEDAFSCITEAKNALEAVKKG